MDTWEEQERLRAAEHRRKNHEEQRRLEREDPELATFYKMSCSDSRWPALSKKMKETRGI